MLDQNSTHKCKQVWGDGARTDLEVIILMCFLRYSSKHGANALDGE